MLHLYKECFSKSSGKLAFFSTILFFAASIFFGTSTLKAQGTQSFNLQQCIEYALKNSPNVSNALLDEKIADARVGQVRATGLPQLTGAATVLDNTQLSRFFLTLDPNNPIFSGFAANLPPDLKGKVVAMNNIFQLKNAGDASASLSQLLFNGSYIMGLKASKTYKELAVKTTTQTKIQTVNAVSKAYYGVLINQERIKLFDQNVRRLDSLLRITKALNEQGFREKIDVNRVQVALNNISTERQKFSDLASLNLLLLKFQMNYPMDQPLIVEGDIKTMAVDTAGLGENKTDYSNRIEYKILETTRSLQQIGVKADYFGYFPTLAVFGKLGYNTQSPTLSGVFTTDTKLPNIPNLPFGPDKWYPYSSIGISLSIPIFDGLLKSYQIQEARLGVKKIDNGILMLKSSIDLQIEQARINFNNNLKTLRVQKQNLDLATDVAKVTKIKYEQGVGANNEVIDAETDLRAAQNNYYESLYNIFISQIDLQTATGTLKF